MSEKISLYGIADGYEDSYKRKVAVEAALELIRAHVPAGPGFALASYLENLDTFADQIQAALEVK